MWFFRGGALGLFLVSPTLLSGYADTHDPADVFAFVLWFTVGGFITFHWLIKEVLPSWVSKAKKPRSWRSRPPSPSSSPTLFLNQMYLKGWRIHLSTAPLLSGSLKLSPPKTPRIGDIYVDLVADDVYVCKGVDASGQAVWDVVYKAGTPEAMVHVQAAIAAAQQQGLDRQGKPIAPRKLEEPVVGFRVFTFEYIESPNRWDVMGRTVPGAMDLHIYSLNRMYGEWLPGVNVSRCQRHSFVNSPHKAPAHGCHCGFWIKNTLAGAQLHSRGLKLIGAVQGWGKVIEHEDGWRCEYASVVAFMDPWADSIVPPNLWKEKQAIAALARKFDVPVVKGDLEMVRMYQTIPTPPDKLRVLRCDRCGFLWWPGDSQITTSPCMATVPLSGMAPCHGTMRLV